MKRTKAQVMKDLNLSELPSDNFMELLEQVADIPVEIDEYGHPNVKIRGDLANAAEPSGKGWTPEDIIEVLKKETGIDFGKELAKK